MLYCIGTVLPAHITEVRLEEGHVDIIWVSLPSDNEIRTAAVGPTPHGPAAWGGIQF